MSAVEVLTTVREALSDPERWYQHESWPGESAGIMELDRLGREKLGERAERACLIGACSLAKGHYDMGRWKDAPEELWAAVREHGGLTIADFNDDPSTTHADILNVLDRAIELAREEEGS